MTTTPDTNHYSKAEAIADSDAEQMDNLLRNIRLAYTLAESARSELASLTDTTGHIWRAEETLSQAKRLITSALSEVLQYMEPE